MELDTAVYLFSLLQSMTVLFFIIYFIVTLSDLECDYINAQSCCDRLNRWVRLEMIATVVLSVVLILSWHPYLFICSLPMSCWLIYRLLRVPAGSMGVYDATEIHNRNLLKSHLKESLAKLAYHVCSFFLYLVCMIVMLAANTEFKPMHPHRFMFM